MTFKIAILPGDGIGPEVMEEAVKVLKVIENKYGLDFKLSFGLLGGAAYDMHGTPFPNEVKELCENSDAILLGSIGGSKWENLPPEKTPEIGGLLCLRKSLDLYANLRPVIIYKELEGISPLSSNILQNKIDILTVRELSSGIYFGKLKELSENMAFDTMLYTREEVEKIAEVAFETARKRRKKVTSIDKANVLFSSKLWRKVVCEVAIDYPDVELKHMYIDNAAMQMILNPSQFDVILTSNLFGDIISDESAAISGSLGLLPSASLGQRVHLYEPAGGSAPDIAGKGSANPIAQIISVSMMMEHSFERTDIAEDIKNAVSNTIKKGYRTEDIKGDYFSISTSHMGDKICEELVGIKTNSIFDCSVQIQ